MAKTKDCPRTVAVYDAIMADNSLGQRLVLVDVCERKGEDNSLNI